MMRQRGRVSAQTTYRRSPDIFGWADVAIGRSDRLTRRTDLSCVSTTVGRVSIGKRACKHDNGGVTSQWTHHMAANGRAEQGTCRRFARHLPTPSPFVLDAHSPNAPLLCRRTFSAIAKSKRRLHRCPSTRDLDGQTRTFTVSSWTETHWTWQLHHTRQSDASPM